MRVRASRDARGLFVGARRDVTRPFAGAYRSAFRGHGLIFDELRDYVPGDDAQWIEWNATARLARPITKQMREEREAAVALLVDVSDSGLPGHGESSRKAVCVRAAAALAYAAVQVGDPVALCCFGGPTLRTWPARTGQAHLERLLQGMAHAPGGSDSDLRAPLHWACERLPRHSIVILLSDGYCEDPGALLALCARRHELIVLRLEDAIDHLAPNGAQARVVAAEDGRLGSWRARGPVARLSLERLRSRGAVAGSLEGTHVIADLRRFFARRAGLVA